MSEDLRDLYQEVILDHNKRPRNFVRPADTNAQADGFNPLCGDKVTVFLKVEGGVVRDLGFQGAGCAISTASASLMTEQLKGKTLPEVQALFEGFQRMVTSDVAAPPGAEGLGKLEVLAGVREFPMRIKCATLAWHTLKAALEDEREPVSTE